MTKIGLLGDIHGNKSWIKFALWKMHEEGVDILLQVGDFGIYRDNSSLDFLKIANREAEKYGITIYVTPGNHEDHTWINEIYAANPDNEWAKLRSNIFIAPRGFRWEWDGVTFVSLGGAPSVDRGWRRRADALHPNAKNPLWDAGEAITLEDVSKTVLGGYADVMVGHDAPMGVPTIDRSILGNPHGFEPLDILYAQEGRAMMDQAFRGVAPLTFFHGHYHVAVNDMILRPHPGGYSDLEPDRHHWTNVVGLNCDDTGGALGHFDTESRESYIWDVSKDVNKYDRRKT